MDFHLKPLRQLNPEDSAAWIEEFVTAYRHQHPEYRPPERSDHPAIIMINLHNAAVDELGDVVTYWALLIYAMRHWFAPREDSFAYRTLKARFGVACGLSEGNPDIGRRLGRLGRMLIEWERTE